jgi:hypothetical protein
MRKKFFVAAESTTVRPVAKKLPLSLRPSLDEPKIINTQLIQGQKIEN